MEYKWFATVPCHLVKFLTLLVCEIGKMSKEHKNSFEGEDFPTPLLLEMFTCSSIATTRQICLTKFRDLIPHHSYEFKTDKMEFSDNILYLYFKWGQALSNAISSGLSARSENTPEIFNIENMYADMHEGRVENSAKLKLGCFKSAPNDVLQKVITKYMEAYTWKTAIQHTDIRMALTKNDSNSFLLAMTNSIVSLMLAKDVQKRVSDLVERRQNGSALATTITPGTQELSVRVLPGTIQDERHGLADLQTRFDQSLAEMNRLGALITSRTVNRDNRDNVTEEN